MGKNVILLANGKGTRFQHHYPDTPKPLVRYRDVPLIEWSLRSILESRLATIDKVIVVSMYHDVIRYCEDFLGLHCIHLGPTSSPAQTLLSVRDEWYRWQSFYTTDCDVRFNVIGCDFNANHILPVFTSNNPAYSYITERSGLVQLIKEKELISNRAVIGVYPFDTKLLETFFASSMFIELSDEREVYLSDIVSFMISKGMIVYSRTASYFKPLGTPHNLIDD